MAQFTPYTNAPNDPSYLGYSKEFDAPKANTTLSTAIKGIADVGGNAIKGVDEVIKNSAINDPLAKGIDKKIQESTEIGLDLIKDITSGKPQVEGSSDTVGVGPDQETNTPPGISSGLQRMAKINQATKQGRFDDVYLTGQIQEMTQNLVSRYPGYRDYIVDRATHLMGNSPANAQRLAVQRTLAQLYSDKNSTEQKWTHEVMTYAKYLDKDGNFGSVNVQQALAAGNDPVKQASIRAHVASLQASEFRLDRNSKVLDNEMKTSKVNADRFEQYAHNLVNEIVSSGMSNFMFTAGGQTGNLNDIMKKVSDMQKNGTVDPEALKSVGLGLGQLRDNMSNTMDSALRAPISKDNPRSIASLINDPTKIEAIKKQYLSSIDTIISQVGQDNTHLATANAAVIKNMKDNAVLKVMGLETIQKMAGIEGALGQSAGKVLDLMHTQNTWKEMGELGKNLTTLRMQRTITGLNKEGLEGIVTDYQRASQASTGSYNPTEPPSEYLKANIELVKQLVTNPDLPVDMRIKAASEIANDKTINFIQRFDKNKQFDTWATIYAPEVTKGIKLTMPQDTWNKYRTLGEETFVRLFNTYIDTVNQGVQDNRGINPRWNEATQQIDYDERRIPRGVALADPARVSINRLNAGLRTYANILKEDGEVITTDRLKALGLELDLKLQNPNAGDLLKTLNTIPSEGTPKLFQKTGKGDSQSPAASPRGELDSFLAKHSLPGDTPMYQGKELIKNPNDVIKDAKLGPNGNYYVKRNGEWFKITLPSR